MVNPLAKVPHVETRGKQVRPCRAFTEEELQRLFAVAGRRRLAYQMLLYTGQRKSEVRALLWSDVHLDEAKPYALFRESTTKDKDKRAVPLRPEIVGQLKELRPKPEETHMLSKPIFWFRWPTYDILRWDLKRAGIERVDALGRSVHFSFLPQNVADARGALRHQSARRTRSPRVLGREPHGQGLHRCPGFSASHRDREAAVDRLDATRRSGLRRDREKRAKHSHGISHTSVHLTTLINRRTKIWEFLSRIITR